MIKRGHNQSPRYLGNTMENVTVTEHATKSYDHPHFRIMDNCKISSVTDLCGILESDGPLFEWYAAEGVGQGTETEGTFVKRLIRLRGKSGRI